MMEKIIEFQPGYDKRDPDPSKNYGIGDMRILFVLKGPEGAVQFLMGTGWYIPAVDAELKKNGHDLSGPRGWDLGYHSPKPKYDGQTIISEDCPYVDGGKCYYDGSGLAAEPILDAFLIRGADAVWEALEAEYKDVFGD